jgi:pimeloyl-ACP methyl ester carboxylesterase
VLLHGPGANPAHRLRVIPARVARHRVNAPDLPGHGATLVGEGELDGERALRWLGDLCAQCCAEPPSLLGQLLGGAIALRFALAHPEQVARLVLVDSFGLRAFEPTPEFALALTRFQAEPSAHTHEQLWRRCAHDLPALRSAMGELWAPFESYNVACASTREARSALPALMAEFGLNAIAAHDLARIAPPTSSIWGRNDLATPLAVAEAASLEYGWPLFVVDHANDDPAIEQPEAFLRALVPALAHSARLAGARP